LEANSIDFDIDTFRISYDTDKGYTKASMQVLPISKGPSRPIFDGLKKELQQERTRRIALELELAIQNEDNYSTLEELVESVVQS
jgi:hypothetical protein